MKSIMNVLKRKAVRLTVFGIFLSLLSVFFIACSDGSSGGDKDGGASGDSVVCTYYMKEDTSVYYVFYGDGSVEYYSKGELQYKRGVLRYKGNPKSEGTVDITVNTGTLLVTFKVSYVNKVLVPTVELVPGFPVEYTLTLDGENNNGENSGTDKENTEGSGENGNGENDNTENVNTCKWVLDADHSIYFIFYPDNTVEYYSYDSLEYDRSTLNYEGSPTEAGTVTIKVNTGVPLFTFTVTKNGSSVTAKENNMGLTYTMAGDSSNNGESGNDENGGTETPEEPSTDIDESPLMFMGFDNVVTIEKGTDITGITNTIYSLTSDTTLKFKGGINSITLTTIAAAMGTNDSVKIALDFSEATGITEWTNKLAGLKTLYAISLPGTVTSIVSGAFDECKNLQAVTIPVSLTSHFSVDAEYINFTGTIENWLKSSFELSSTQLLYINGKHISSFKGTIEIPDTFTSIKNTAFYKWRMESVIIPETVTKIGDSAFSDCTELTSITIPENVKTIGENAFSNCYSLTRITIPKNVESLGYAAFYNCTALKELVFEAGDTNLKLNGEYRYNEWNYNSIFNACPLKSIYLGRNLYYYKTPEYGSPFYRITTLISVEITNNVLEIGSYMFSGCSGLSNITIPSSVTSIGEYAFLGTGASISLYSAGVYTNFVYRAFFGCSSVNVTIEDGVTSIADYAFSDSDSYGYKGARDFTSVTIPVSVTFIGERAFYNCENLTTINYRGTEEQWKNITKGVDWFYYSNYTTGSVSLNCNYTGD